MATSFTLNGQTIRVLDMDAERDSHGRVYSEPEKTFAEQVNEYLCELTFEERQEKVLTAYSEVCVTQITANPRQIFRLSLAGQTYVYSRRKKCLVQAPVAMVLGKKGNKFIPLWDQRCFKQRSCYVFLNEKELSRCLGQVFEQVELTLGRLTHKGVAAIAWQVTTEDGEYFIPWHSGCILKGNEEFTFEEQTLEEMNKVYDLLKFEPNPAQRHSYIVTCC